MSIVRQQDAAALAALQRLRHRPLTIIPLAILKCASDDAAAAPGMCRAHPRRHRKAGAKQYPEEYASEQTRAVTPQATLLRSARALRRNRLGTHRHTPQRTTKHAHTSLQDTTAASENTLGGPARQQNQTNRYERLS